MVAMDRWCVRNPAPLWHDPLPGLLTCSGLQTLISHDTSWYKQMDKAKEVSISCNQMYKNTMAEIEKGKFLLGYLVIRDSNTMWQFLSFKYIDQLC